MKTLIKIVLLVISLNVSLFAQENYKWEKINLPDTAKGSSIAINNQNEIFVGTKYYGILKSIDDGQTWIKKNNNIDSLHWPYFNMYINGYLRAHSSKGDYLSTDDGENWFFINESSSNRQFLGVSQAGNSYIRISDVNKSEYFTLISTDKGASWDTLHNIFENVKLNGFYPIFGNNNRILLQTRLVNETRDSLRIELYLSTDECQTWKKIKTEFLENSYQSDTYFDMNNKGDIFYWKFINFKGFYWSSDDGVTWNFNPYDSINVFVSQLFWDKNDNLFLCNGLGISKSTNNGEIWYKIASEEFKGNSPDLAINDDGVIYALTSNDGGLLYRGEKISDVKTENNICDITIYPNPASENITLTFSNPKLSITNLSILNTIGTEIKRFDVKELLGQSSIKFTTEELSSGIYYCSLNYGMNRIIKSFVVLR